MPKFLTQKQVKDFHREGFISSVRVMSKKEASEILEKLEAFEASQGKPVSGIQRTKACLLFPWIYDLVTRKTVLDVIEDLIGPNILLYQNGAWLKEADGKGFVSWHQDSTYFGMDPWELVTAWVALSPAGTREGCMEVVPGSQTLGMLPYDFSAVSPFNMLASGQRVNYEIDESKVIPMALRPGEMSLHHVNTLHRSKPNYGEKRRVGFSLACCAPRVKQTTKAKSSATLLRGEDTHGNFILNEKPPVAPDDKSTIAAHARAVKLYRAKSIECGNETSWRLG